MNKLIEIDELKLELKKTQKLYLESLNRIDNAIEYIKWHYDLGTKENVEFCLLRDRLLEILGGTNEYRK